MAFSGVLMKKDLSIKSTKKVIEEAKVVLVHFSAKFIGKCCYFTTRVNDFYYWAPEGVCIMLVSSDKSEAEFLKYFQEKHGDGIWCVPFADEMGINLWNLCKVHDIPALCQVSKDGLKCLEKNVDIMVHMKAPLVIRDILIKNQIEYETNKTDNQS